MNASRHLPPSDHPAIGWRDLSHRDQISQGPKRRGIAEHEDKVQPSAAKAIVSSHVSTTRAERTVRVPATTYSGRMHLIYTDGRDIAELCDFHTRGRAIGTAPINYTASISTDGARRLQRETASFYRGREGDSRFTLTIDEVGDRMLSGTVRRR